jgi:hypothetical protein
VLGHGGLDDAVREARVPQLDLVAERTIQPPRLEANGLQVDALAAVALRSDLEGPGRTAWADLVIDEDERRRRGGVQGMVGYWGRPSLTS